MWKSTSRGHRRLLASLSFSDKDLGLAFPPLERFSGDKSFPLTAGGFFSAERSVLSECFFPSPPDVSYNVKRNVHFFSRGGFFLGDSLLPPFPDCSL